MSYTALGRCASSRAVYDIQPSFSVFNSHLFSEEQRIWLTHALRLKLLCDC